MWLVFYVAQTSSYISTMPTTSLTYLMVLEMYLPILSQKISKATFLSIFRNSTPGLPQCLTLHLQNFDSMCQTMKPFSNYPMSVVALVVAFIVFAVFVFLVFVFVLLFFRSFLPDSPAGVWVWSLLIVSDYISFIQKYYQEHK